MSETRTLTLGVDHGGERNGRVVEDAGGPSTIHHLVVLVGVGGHLGAGLAGPARCTAAPKLLAAAGAPTSFPRAACAACSHARSSSACL
jgi:hypothetical protein